MIWGLWFRAPIQRATEGCFMPAGLVKELGPHERSGALEVVVAWLGDDPIQFMQTAVDEADALGQMFADVPEW